MARAQIGETDSLPASRTYLNANIAKDDALQTATGIAESGTNIGAIGTLPTGAVQSTDTLRSGLLKVEGRTPVAGPKHGVDSLRTARELAANYDYKTAVEGIEGTTAVDIAGASAQEYPDADGIYTLEVVRSGGGGGSAGRTIVVTATKAFKRWVRIKSEGTWGAWIQADGVAPAHLVTQADAGRTAYSIGAEEWRTRLVGGLYAASYTLAQATSYGMPLDGLPDATVGWLIEILRTGTLTATARVSGTYTHTDEASVRVHTFTAELTRANDAATSWTVGTWQGVSPRVLPARSVHPEAFSIYDWTLTKPAALTETFPTLPRRTQTGWAPTASVRELRPNPTGTTYYVDTAGGDDSANGLTTSTPLRSIAVALGKTTPGRILIAPGHYRNVDGPGTLITGLGTTYQIHLEKWPIRPGEVIISSGQPAGTWTSVGGATPNVYTHACTFLSGVIDLATLDRNGMPMVYTEVADATRCNLIPGSWYDAGSNVVGVHPFNSTVPTQAIVPMRDLRAAEAIGRQTVILDSITFIGGNSGVLLTNTSVTNGGAVWANNCRFMGLNGHGYMVNGFEQSVTQDCEASGSALDGFHYIPNAGGAVAKRIVEIDCRAYDNGWNTNGTGNGSSAHADTQTIRIGGHYARNRGPQVADVDDSVTWCCGTRAGASTSVDANFTHSGFVFVTAAATAYLYECASTQNFQDLVAAAPGKVYIDRCEFTTLSEPIGTNILPYDQV